MATARNARSMNSNLRKLGFRVQPVEQRLKDSKRPKEFAMRAPPNGRD